MSATETKHAVPCERCGDLGSPEVATGEPIPVPPWPCHIENMRKAQARRDVLLRAGHLVWESGDEEAALAVYAEAESAWDDAIHISDPTDPARSLCGSLGRDLVVLAGPRPGSSSGCWGCLYRADKLAAEERSS